MGAAKPREGDLPAVTITGLIGPLGIAWARDGREPWCKIWEFEAWRIGDGQIIRKPMRVHLANNLPPRDRPLGPISAYAIVRVEGRLNARSRWGEIFTQALADASPAHDAELDAIGRELQTPVVHTDEVLGDLTLNRAHGSFEGAITWMKVPIELSLDVRDQEELPSAITHAKRLLASDAEWDARLRQHAVDDLLEVKNEAWLEGEPPWSEEQLRRALIPNDLTVRPDGSFVLDFDDGDAFGGHAVSVSVSADGVPGDVDLIG
ncbi:MAG: DUF2262 domain-containing protein [Phycisphaeraceae bacterium]|nr:DUF2262 domain-containing protein [Phycisphaeraceae bacterium]